MIKLFWNTHNQVTPKTKEPNDERVIDYNWGLYHRKNSDKWIYRILSKLNYKIIESYKELNSGDRLIIIDSSIDKKIDLYTKLNLICSKIFLIHLGDESSQKDLSPIYDKCNFIWRTFCNNKYFNKEKISCLPIGYKSGVELKNPDNDRKYKWSFLGNIHKASRHDLLFQLSDIKPSFCYKTKQFNVKIIEADEMNVILSSTIFLPCPNGFIHPETYRLYEALECGCIPIVQNTYKYYDRLIPKNPFVKIDIWKEAREIINSWDEEKIKKKKNECKIWWKQYIEEIQNKLNNKINS